VGVQGWTEGLLKELKARQAHGEEWGWGGGDDKEQHGRRGHSNHGGEGVRGREADGSEAHVQGRGLPQALPLDVYEMYMRAESERCEMRQQRDACLDAIHALKSHPCSALKMGQDGEAAAENRSDGDSRGMGASTPLAREGGFDACWSDSSRNSSDCGDV
jgi:hypothetical protein